MICCVCSRDREPGSVLKLTESEREHVRRLTREEPPESYVYCKACWQVVTDRNQGAQLFKGLMQAGLRRNGVRNADQMAARYFQLLVDRAAKKPVA